LQSEDQLCQQPSEDPTNLRALQRARRLAASLLRLAWLLVLFSPVVLAAPLVGFPYIGITRLRWLRLLRWTLERAGPGANLAATPAARLLLSVLSGIGAARCRCCLVL
jgi:hypothetical protein